MKKKNLLIAFTILLFSCGGNKQESERSSAAVVDRAADGNENINTSVKITDLSSITGKFFVGDFMALEYHKKDYYTEKNRITISITKLMDKVVEGFSCVAGNRRPFSGDVISQTDSTISCKVKEPGDDKYDGVFEFTVNLITNTMNGTWLANNTSIAVFKRSFSLSPMEFLYRPEAMPDKLDGNEIYNKELGDNAIEFLTDAVDKINASTTELKKEDIENLYKGDLEVIRNTIYARHGYSFKTKRMRYIFDNFVPWYIPLYTDVRNELTELEKKNIELLKRYEEHAGTYYDSFGR